MTDGEYLKLITTKSESQLRSYVDYLYDIFKKNHNYEASFGPEGSKEFICSLFLAEHDLSTSKLIFDAATKVFERKMSPLDFSNTMDNIVTNSNIRYETWSSAFRYLHFNHEWIKNHPCASLKNL